MTLADLSELPLDAQFLRATIQFNAAAEPWPILTDLATLHLPCAPSSLPTLPPLEAGQQRADAAISTLQEVSANASAAHLISANEDLDEISSPTLKYLLLPYLRATAHAAWQGEPSIRLTNLRSAADHLTTFFAAMDRLSLLSPSERARVLPDDDTDPTPSLSAAAARDLKIARFRAERDAARRLDALVARARGVDADEEAVREAALLTLQSAVRRGLDLRAQLVTEMQLLSWAERQRSRGTDPRERAERARGRRPPPPVPGMPQSFRIVNEREAEREKVFRPSHSLPTYTVEEWGRIEAEMMAKRQAEESAREGIKAKKREEEDSDDDEVVNRETMKSREWDNWKDEHNRGSGNTIR